MNKSQFIDYIRPHKNFVISLKAIIILFLIFNFFRILFFIYHFNLFNSASGNEIFKSFLIGIRFDLSAVMMLSGLFLILLNLPGKFKFSNYYILFVLSLYFIFIVIGLLIFAGDIYYYDFAKRRLSYEIFNLFKTIPELITIIIKTYLFALIGFVILILLFGYIWYKYVPRTKFKYRYNVLNDILYFIILVGLIFILIRGGFQLKPLRESYAFRGDNLALGHLTLNPVFTVIRTLNRGDIQDYKFLNDNESKKTVRELIKDKNEEFKNDEYPLMRAKYYGLGEKKRMNIVIFVMESWPGDILELENGTAAINFNKLVSKGKYYKLFFSSGQRTIQGIQAIIGSIPNVVYDDILGSPIEQHSLRQLGSILKEVGYQTIFIHGARAGSMGFEAYSKLAGFDKYISKEDFDLSKVQDDGTWGVFDHYVFERANQEFEKINKPFLGFIMSLSSHAPYNLPSKEFEYYDSTVVNFKFLNSLRYSDWSLGEFFKQAEKMDYFNNSIFIITADHAEGTREKNIFELFHIPCLIYSPAHIFQGVDSSVHSQVDIFPTVLDILQVEAVHSSFGKSMLSGENTFAFFSTGNLFGWVRNKWLLVGDYEKNIGLYDIINDKDLYVNRLDDNINVSSIMRKEVMAYIQTAVQLLKYNKVYKMVK